MDHIFLHCELAKGLLLFVWSLFEVNSAMPRTMLDLLACWKDSLGKIKNKYSR